jgi:hypothetical protein
MLQYGPSLAVEYNYTRSTILGDILGDQEDRSIQFWNLYFPFPFQSTQLL